MSIARLFTQTVTVQGSGPYGPVGTPVVKACYIDDSTNLVRNAQGQEVVSSARLYGPISDADVYEPGTVVTVNGAEHTVISMARRNAAGPVSAHHVEVRLT